MKRLSWVMVIVSGALFWMNSFSDLPLHAQAKTERRYEIKKVFESAGKSGEHCRSNWNPLAPEQWCSSRWSGQVLDPEGDRIYRRDGRNVEIIAWKQDKIVLRRDFQELSCPDAGGNYFSLWVPIPNKPDIVAVFCSALFVIDKSSLTVRKKLADLDRYEVRNIALLEQQSYFALASDGRWFALAGTDFKLYNTNGWDLVTSFARNPKEQVPPDSRILVPGGIPDLSQLPFILPPRLLPNYTDAIFTGDGKFLAREIGGCKLEVRAIPSGEVLSTFSINGPDGTCGYGRLYRGPGEKHWVARLNKLCYDHAHPQCTLTVWNLENGNLVEYVTFEGEIGVQVRPDSLLFAPDWSWILSAPASQFDFGNKYRQDFFLWHPITGKLLYETPRFPIGRFSSDYGLDLIDVSADGRFVLTYQAPEMWKGARLAIWEIIPNEDGNATDATR